MASQFLATEGTHPNSKFSQAFNAVVQWLQEIPCRYPCKNSCTMSRGSTCCVGVSRHHSNRKSPPNSALSRCHEDQASILQSGSLCQSFHYLPHPCKNRQTSMRSAPPPWLLNCINSANSTCISCAHVSSQPSGSCRRVLHVAVLSINVDCRVDLRLSGH